MAGACGRAQAPASKTAHPPAPPHIVLIVADDLGWADVGYHNEEVRTPHIDALARAGVVLERFYTQPVCTPTRAALLTGRHPIRYGMAYGPLKPWETSSLPPETPTLAEVLQSAGYATALVGKWHVGHSSRAAHPGARGFERFYGCLQGAIDHLSHERAGAVDFQRDGVTVGDAGYDTDLFAAEAVRIIEDHDPGRPLFLELAFTSPHTPLQAPDELVAKYAQLPERRRLVCAMVEQMDAAIGRVRAALQRRGMDGNTLVFFCSDNGGARRDGGRNLPLNGGKATSFEGGIRVPALAHWPGRIEGGRTAAQFMTALDLLPTLADAAGATLPAALDGRSMLAQLRGGEPLAREDLFFCDQDDEGNYWHALIRMPWKLVRQDRADGSVEQYLFDIAQDPTEKSDLAAGNPEVVSALAAAIAVWRAASPGEPPHSSEPPEGWKPPKDWAEPAR
ncbi:MAG: arylsulfatase [Planctomycetota bacterium]|nr:MAG: arylsulfatase [Planctomycetota bacterium]